MATVSCILACTISWWFLRCWSDMLVHSKAPLSCFSNVIEHTSILGNTDSGTYLDGNYISAIDAYEGYNVRTGEQLNS